MIAGQNPDKVNFTHGHIRTAELESLRMLKQYFYKQCDCLLADTQLKTAEALKAKMSLHLI